MHVDGPTTPNTDVHNRVAGIETVLAEILRGATHLMQIHTFTNERAVRPALNKEGRNDR